MTKKTKVNLISTGIWAVLVIIISMAVWTPRPEDVPQPLRAIIALFVAAASTIVLLGVVWASFCFVRVCVVAIMNIGEDSADR